MWKGWQDAYEKQEQQGVLVGWAARKRVVCGEKQRWKQIVGCIQWRA